MFRDSPDSPADEAGSGLMSHLPPRGGIQFYPVKPDGPVWLAFPSGAPLVIPSPREFPFLATNRAHECLTKQGNASCQYSVFGSLSVR